MKNLFFIFFIIPVTIYSQTWQWAKQFGTSSHDGSTYGRVITDGTNIYLIGRYNGYLNLQTDTFGTYGINDMIIIKYDQNGNEVWVRRLGGDNGENAYENVNGVFDQYHNCIYLAGNYWGTMYLSQTITLHPVGEIFLTKIDLNGNFLWAKTIDSGSSYKQYENNYANVFVEPCGDILLAGRLIDTGYIEGNKIVPGGFLCRYDSSGNLKWAEHRFSGPEKHSINISFIGNDIIMAGSFDNNPSIIDTVTLIPHNSSDGYLTRLDSTGHVKWVRTFGGNGMDGISGISIDQSGNIYAVGLYVDTFYIDSIYLASNVDAIIFLKYDQYGNIIWVRHPISTGPLNTVLSIAYIDSNKIYTTGYFSGFATFGSFNLSTTDRTDMFIARYDFNGNCLDIENFGNAYASNLAVDNSGNVICAGNFSGTVYIGSISITSIGTDDVYIAKWNPDNIYPSPKNDQLFIYANPSTGKCNIIIPDEFKNENNLTLNVYNSKGILILKTSIIMSQEKVKLNLQAQATGVYNAILTNGSKKYYGKIVFE